jgi:hypothetical protein
MPSENKLLHTLQNFTTDVNGTLKEKKDTNYFHNHESYEINYSYGQIGVTLTVYFQLIPERGRGPYTTKYTRIEIPFDNAKGVFCKMTMASSISRLFNLFTASRIKTGNKRFDSEFLLTGTPAESVKLLFLKQEIYQTIRDFNDVYLTISNDKDNPNIMLKPNQSILQININYVFQTKDEFMKLNRLAVDIIESILQG